MVKGEIGIVVIVCPGDFGFGGADQCRSQPSKPSRVYHQEQGLRLQRQERPRRGRLGEPDFYQGAAGVAEAH